MPKISSMNKLRDGQCGLFQSYVQYGSPKMFMKKSDSERALVTQDRFFHKLKIILLRVIKF